MSDRGPGVPHFTVVGTYQPTYTHQLFGPTFVQPKLKALPLPCPQCPGPDHIYHPRSEMPKRRHPAPSLLYIYTGATTTTTTTPYHRSTTLIVTHPQNRQMSPKALINRHATQPSLCALASYSSLLGREAWSWKQGSKQCRKN